MSEMVERVAKAIRDAEQMHWNDMARAAIEAMREPIIAAVLKDRNTNGKKYIGRYFEDCIPEMIGDAIDEALK